MAGPRPLARRGGAVSSDAGGGWARPRRGGAAPPLNGGWVQERRPRRAPPPTRPSSSQHPQSPTTPGTGAAVIFSFPFFACNSGLRRLSSPPHHHGRQPLLHSDRRVGAAAHPLRHCGDCSRPRRRLHGQRRHRVPVRTHRRARPLLGLYHLRRRVPDERPVPAAHRRGVPPTLHLRRPVGRDAPVSGQGRQAHAAVYGRGDERPLRVRARGNARRDACALSSHGRRPPWGRRRVWPAVPVADARTRVVRGRQQRAHVQE